MKNLMSVRDLATETPLSSQSLETGPLNVVSVSRHSSLAQRKPSNLTSCHVWRTVHRSFGSPCNRLAAAPSRGLSSYAGGLALALTLQMRVKWRTICGSLGSRRGPITRAVLVAGRRALRQQRVQLAAAGAQRPRRDGHPPRRRPRGFPNLLQNVPDGKSGHAHVDLS